MQILNKSLNHILVARLAAPPRMTSTKTVRCWILRKSQAQLPVLYVKECPRLQASFPLGKTENLSPFTTHEIEYSNDLTFYLFTDGFADQFGGEKGKKFKYKQLEELLLNNNNLALSAQSILLNQNFESWKGQLEQVDDVCVIGLKI